MNTFATFLCVLFACALVCGAPPSIKSIRTIHNDCQADPATHVEDEVFRAVRHGETFDRVKVGAHMLCMSTKSGTQNEDGTINKSVLKKVLAHDITDETKLEEVTNKCAEEGPTPSETALKLSKCIGENTSWGRHGHGGHGHGHHHHGHHHHED